MKILIKFCAKLFGKKNLPNASTALQKSSDSNPSLGLTTLRRPEDRPHLYSERPTFLRGFKKMAQGAGFFLIRYIFDLIANNPDGSQKSIVNEISTVAGVAFLIDGGQECVNAFLYIAGNKRKNKDSQYADIVRKERIVKNALNLITTGLSLVYSYNNFRDQLEKNISPFAFSFPPGIESRDTGPIMYYISVPFTATAFSILFVQAFIYNSRELVFSLISSKPRRDDPPLFKFINALSYIASTAYLARKFNFMNSSVKLRWSAEELQKTSVEEVMRKIEETTRTIGKPSILLLPAGFVNQLGRYEAYKGFAQILSNIQEVFWDQVMVEVEDTPRTTQTRAHANSGAAPHSVGRQKQNLKPLPKPKPLLFQAENVLSLPAVAASPSVVTSNAGEQSQSNVLDTQNNTPAKPPKVKTQGIPNKHGFPGSQSQPHTYLPHTESHDIKDTKETKENIELENFRKDKLNFITELRCHAQVNKRIIQQELEALTRFLPQAQVKHGDGSENHLCWIWKDKTYNIKFETRHGSDDNEFHGRKLRKVLNVLEAGYLWQWDQVKREAYLSQRTRGTGLEKLMFVFGERPKF